MADWKDRASAVKSDDSDTDTDTPAAATGSSWKDRATKVDPDSVAPKVGSTEALLRGVEQGATMGFAPRVNAGLSALLDSLSANPQGIVNKYNNTLSSEQAAMEAAGKQHPYMYGAGNVGGALAPALLTGGGSLAEEGLAGAAKMGAMYGGVGGLAGTQDLTDIPQALKNTATGAMTGAIAGPIASAVAKPVVAAAGRIGSGLAGAAENAYNATPLPKMVGAFTQGAAGNSLVGDVAGKSINDEVTSLQQKMTNDLQQNAQKAGSQKLDLLSQPGENADLSDWYNNFKQAASNLYDRYQGSPKARQEMSALSDFVDTNINGNDAYHAMQEVAEMDPAEKAAFLEQNPDAARALQSGQPVAPMGLNPTAQQAETFLRQLGKFGTEGDRPLSSEVKTLVDKMVSGNEGDSAAIRSLDLPEEFQPLKEVVNDTRPPSIDADGNATPSLSSLNDTINTNLQALDKMPTLNQMMSYDSSKTTGAEASKTINDFLDTLPSDLKDQYGDQIQDIAKRKGLYQVASGTGLDKGLLQATKSTAVTGSNIAGQGLGWATGTLQGAGKYMYNAAPDAVRDMAQNVAKVGGDVGQKLSTALSGSADRDMIGRNAIMFAIQQNPQYRDILRQLGYIPKENE